MARSDVLLLTCLGLSGCNSDCEDLGDVLLLTDDANYRFSGRLDVASEDLQEGSDPHFDWSGLTHDLQGHDLDPVSDIDNAALIVFAGLSQGEIEQGLSTNTLDQADLALYVSADPGDSTELYLSDLTLFGNDIDVEKYFVQGYGTWLLTLTTGTEPGVGTRTAAFFDPSPESTETDLVLRDESATLSLDVDILSSPEIPVLSGAPDLTVDWSGLTVTGQGTDVADAAIDQVMVGWYENLDSQDLQDRFLDVEILADRTWIAGTSGTQTSLAELTGESGSFEGVSDEGTWVLALRCTTCANPAPPFFGVLAACP